MRAPVAIAILSAFVFAASACSRGPRADQITKIAVTQNICDPHCRFWGATLYPGDAEDISGDAPEDDMRTRAFRGTFAALADWLPRTTFFTGKSDYRRDPDPADSTYVTAWTGTTERQVAIPSSEPVTAGDRSMFDLHRFASFVGSSVYAAHYKARADMKKRLANLRELALVEYDAKGCYGTCPAYAVRFYPDAHATISTFDPLTRGRVDARAMVPFTTIVHVLQTCQFTELRTRYRLRTADVFGASLHLRYRDGFTFDSEAPDESQWSDQFGQIAARLDQVVLDTQWTPPLPARRYRAP